MIADIKCETGVESGRDRNIYYESDSGVENDDGIAGNLYNMFKQGDHTEVQFAVSSGDGSEITFSAHKLILSLWSPYFEDMFSTSDTKMDKSITIKDVNPVAFEGMLRFMYAFSLL